MTFVDFIAALGFGFLLWMLVGLSAVLFWVEVKMPPAPIHPPFWAKVEAVLAACATLPWLWITMGRLPSGMVIAPLEVEPEHQDIFEAWKKGVCNCDECRRERGEI